MQCFTKPLPFVKLCKTIVKQNKYVLQNVIQNALQVILNVLQCFT